MMYTSVVLAAGLATLAQAFSQPADQTWGPLLTPDTSNAVTQGKTFKVTWDPEDHPTDGVTVSLVLCHGPGSNCVLQDSAIVEKLPASQKSYDWKVPCDLAPGVQSTSTGYGMLIIVDGTGEFQYSTQFSVDANSACGSTPPTGITASPSSSGPPSSVKTSSTGSAIVLGPPAYATSSYVPNGNLSTTAAPTWTALPGTTVIVSTASDGSVWTYGGSTYAVTPTGTVEGSTMTTSVAATLTSGGAGGTSAAGAATSAAPFNGGAAGQLGSSMAGMVIAGAVAVFAF